MNRSRLEFLKLPETGLSLLLVVTLLATVYLYWPGLYGPFVFDDIPNLAPLGFFGGVTDLPSALNFIFGNESGPLGRPLSMATFLLNDFGWPSDAFSFKYTNLLLHLINGCLIFKLLIQLGSQLNCAKIHSQWMALLATALWLIHPFNVSTVLYVVQRMTILSTLFILLALVLYMRVRVKGIIVGVGGQIILLIQIGVIGLIGLLFKETASLLVIYIAVLEFVLFRKSEGWRVFRVLLIVACLLFCSMIVVQAFVIAKNSWQIRGFTMSDRVLTQSRILWDYFFHIVLPRSAGSGLMHDDYLISRGLISPWTTLISVFGLGIVVFITRIKHQLSTLLSVCVFWFLGGHLLESTILPLENYFEHRNYLPMVLILWGGVYIVSKSSKFLKYKVFFATIYFSLVGVVTSSNIQTWSSEALLENRWGMESSTSPRARQLLARQFLSQGSLDAAISVLDDTLKTHPENHHILLQKLILYCLRGDELELVDFKSSVEHGPKNNGVYDGLIKLREMSEAGICSWVNEDTLILMNRMFLENANYDNSSSQSFFYKEIAALWVAKGELSKSIIAMDRAYEKESTNIIYPLTQAQWLASAGLLEEASRYLDIAKNTKPRHALQSLQYEKMYRLTKEQIFGEIPEE